MGFFDFLFDLDGDGKVGADEEFINMMMLNHMEKEMREESSDIDDYDDDIDSFSYSDSQSNMPDTSWRDTCEDGFEYGLDPQDYDDEDEYLDALNEAKYEWRDFCDDEGYEYDVDPEDYETEDEYNAALHEAKYGWRDTCDDGSDYGINPEDYETEDEYLEALGESETDDEW